MGATSGISARSAWWRRAAGGLVHQARVGVGQFEDARHGEEVLRHVGPGGVFQHRDQLQDGVRADAGAFRHLHSGHFPYSAGSIIC
jgi:hypothetical protein